MAAREHGMRRVALATTGLVAVGVTGTAVLAAVAYADTRSDRGSTTQVTPTSTSSSSSSSNDPNSNSNSGPAVTTTTDPGQVTTGGS